MEVRMQEQTIPAGFCQCGCGERTTIATSTDRPRGRIKGQPVRYIQWHKPPPVRSGTNNNRFNGGLCLRSDGRTVIHCRDGTLLMYYRGVMAAHIGRLLRSDEIVHHINEDPSDDRIENLVLTTRAEHIGTHRAQLLEAAQAKGYPTGDDWRRSRGRT
jgi:hypothetical protein